MGIIEFFTRRKKKNGETQMKYFVTEEERKASGSTDYIEFQMGEYADKCWLEDSINVSAEVWDDLKMTKFMREVIPDFDFYATNPVNKEQWQLLVENSRRENCACRDLLEEASPWVDKCFESKEVFTICGI